MIRLTPAAIRRAQRFGRAFALQQAGHTHREIAADVGLSIGGVCRVLRREIKGGRSEAQQRTDAKRRLINQLYRHGKSTVAIGRQLGISRERVSQYLRPLGILGTRGRRHKPWYATRAGRATARRGQRLHRRFLLKVQARRLYRQGLTFREVERALGLGLGSAQRLIPQSMSRPRGPRRKTA